MIARRWLLPAIIASQLLTTGFLWAARPNVVMILADDQSYRDFGFMGNEIVDTPNLDQLAAAAARFPNGYVPMSVCRPSLATLLTGLYPHQHGIHFNHPPPGLSTMRKTMTGDQYRKARATTDALIESVPTLPRILARHGYACLQTGKHWEGDYKTAGFTHGMTLARPAKRIGPITGTREQANGDWVAHGNGDAGLVIGRETMKPIEDFVQKHVGKQPFFVWYAPFLPHTPFDAPQRFHDLYRAKDLPTHLRPYYAEIARFDETVGQLMHCLSHNGALDNTLIVFASDNGFRPDQEKHEKQNARSKLSEFEDGLRTPILIRMPGETKPADHSQLVATVDLVPSILSAVGLSREITPRMRGIDLMPASRGEQTLPSRPAMGAIYPNDAELLGAPSRHARGRWLRWGNYKLILPGLGKRPLQRGLYNLDNDPHEETNLITSIDQTERIAKMTRMLDQWWTAKDDRGVTNSSPSTSVDP